MEFAAFQPFPLAKNGWAQTIGAYLWPELPDRKPDALHTIDLEPGSQLLVAENRPPQWKRGDRIVLMVHGLGGCYRSKYMVRIMRKLLREGFLVLRMNLRNSGPGMGLSNKPYHSGQSEDVREVLRFAKSHWSNSPVTLIGFSLGGNIALKLAGEDASSPTGNLVDLTTVSAPLDLRASVGVITQPSHRLFDQSFVRSLKEIVRELHRLRPELGPVEFPKKMNLYDFDDFYTAPRSGFRDAEDYYAQSSSINFVSKIQIPTLMLVSEDDPVISLNGYDDLNNPHIDLIRTKHGGHVAFLGQKASRWMDDLVINRLVTSRAA